MGRRFVHAAGISCHGVGGAGGGEAVMRLSCLCREWRVLRGIGRGKADLFF